MRYLVMSDAHLHCDLIDKIDELWRADLADQIISLGDWLDDWDALPFEYDRFKEKFLDFVKRHKKHLVLLWGNHDYGYRYMPHQHSGFDDLHWVEHVEWLSKISRTVKPKIVHEDNGVYFSHAGIAKGTYMEFVAQKKSGSDSFVDWVNSLTPRKLWKATGPLWYRPTNRPKDNGFPKRHYQVVGHTPMETVVQHNFMVYTDTWSTWSNHDAYGDQSIIIFDTKEKDWDKF